MSEKHPALQAYEDLWNQIAASVNDASLMPQGSGDIVGRARFEAECKRRGIAIPSNIVDEFKWWEEIGGLRLAKRLTKKYDKLRKARRHQSLNYADLKNRSGSSSSTKTRPAPSAGSAPSSRTCAPVTTSSPSSRKTPSNFGPSKISRPPSPSSAWISSLAEDSA
jgi:hypothetical protein